MPKKKPVEAETPDQNGTPAQPEMTPEQLKTQLVARQQEILSQRNSPYAFLFNGLIGVPTRADEDFELEQIAISLRALSDKAEPALPPLKDVPGTEGSAVQNNHGPDFRSVTWNGRSFSLTSKQAAVINVLWNAHTKGTPDVSWEMCQSAAGIGESSRIRDTFKLLKNWKDLIEKGTRRNTWRLKD